MEEDTAVLNFLESSGSPRIRSDLPSWVPDWSFVGIRSAALLFQQLEDLRTPGFLSYNSPGNMQ